ncbi:MAG: hypothetical protein GYA60_08705 [Candidatus Methanofastidiosa archaeon]|nr:hypothetical protein [Candidatus Methanofastidiosa archaeon]
MQKLPAILLIGSLSMLFAEIFSGASQAWFISGWGLLLTFPLYLFHVLFFLNIAFKLKRITPPQLYLLGVIFGLYESWITKVLWSGYFDSNGPGLGTILGIGVSEFPVLVFFWHPVMSFIVPVLVFELLTRKIHISHASILTKTTRKTALIVISIVSLSAFIANGNKFNLLSSNISLVVTLVIILVFYSLSRRADLGVFNFGRRGFIALSLYLALLYILGFLFLLPERIPNTLAPYATIIVFYLLPILLFKKSKTTDMELIAADESRYSIRDLCIFTIITIVATNLATIFSKISSVVLTVSYLILEFVGIILFIYVVYKILNNIKS